MRKSVLVVCIVLAAASLVGRSASAEPGCGSSIASNFTLSHDIGGCSSGGLTITADNVTLNLNGFRIFGTPGVGDGNGVTVTSRTGTVIKNGTVSGFDEGIRVDNSSQTSISKMRILGNVGDGSASGDGLYVTASATTVVSHSLFEQNGPYSGASISSSSSNGQIIASKAISNNGTGFYLGSGSDDVIRNSVATGNHGPGITLRGLNAQAIHNKLTNNGWGFLSAGLDTAATGAIIKNNKVHSSGVQGIFVSGGTATITHNDARKNAVVAPGFDLDDSNAGCTGDVWRKNKGTKSQSCIH